MIENKAAAILLALGNGEFTSDIDREFTSDIDREFTSDIDNSIHTLCLYKIKIVSQIYKIKKYDTHYIYGGWEQPPFWK